MAERTFQSFKHPGGGSDFGGTDGDADKGMVMTLMVMVTLMGGNTCDSDTGGDGERVLW